MAGRRWRKWSGIFVFVFVAFGRLLLRFVQWLYTFVAAFGRSTIGRWIQRMNTIVVVDLLMATADGGWWCGQHRLHRLIQMYGIFMIVLVDVLCSG